MLGEISDFKMKLRNQMQKNNQIENTSTSDSASTKSSSMFVSITPTGKFTAAAPVPTIAPVVAPAIKVIQVAKTEDESLSHKVEKMSLESESTDEKTIAKMKRKAEKEALEELKKKEEEERLSAREICSFLILMFPVLKDNVDVRKNCVILRRRND